MKNENFKTLVGKMTKLEETEQGKLKGGIQVLTLQKSFNKGDNWALCCMSSK